MTGHDNLRNTTRNVGFFTIYLYTIKTVHGGCVGIKMVI
jgi:hypothetical protein